VARIENELDRATDGRSRGAAGQVTVRRVTCRDAWRTPTIRIGEPCSRDAIPFQSTLASVHVDQAPQKPPAPSILAIVRQIASTLQAAIVASRADGSLRPRMHGFVRTTFTEWQYGEKGIAQHACETSLVAKPVWWGGPLEALIAKMDGEIERAAALLSAIDPTWKRAGDAVVNVCEQLGLAALEGTGWSDGELERLAGLLEATLRKQPVRAWIRN